MKYRNIVISGEIGTGTSTLAKGLANKLDFTTISFGDFFRQYVLDNQIELWDKLSVPADWEYKMDKEFHNKLVTEDKLVVDGHYQGYLSHDIPHVFRILLTCEPQISEERILKRNHTHEETPETIRKRRQGLVDSFHKLYGPSDHLDPKLFQLVIDTGKFNTEETLEKAYQGFIDANKDYC